MTRTKKILVIGIPVLIAIGVAAKMVSGADKKFPVVTVQKAERTDLRSLVTANGKTEAQRKVDLSALVMGQIVNLAVREGDAVKKGDFLLQIDMTQRRATAVGAEESLKALFFDRDAARARPSRPRRASSAPSARSRTRSFPRPMSTAPALRSRRPTPTGRRSSAGSSSRAPSWPAPATTSPRPPSARRSTASSPPCRSRRARSPSSGR